MTRSIPPFLAEIDLGVFKIESQTSPGDRRSLLRIQRFVSTKNPAYNYLEIGSYLGGTLPPYLMDQRCTAVISLDPRPELLPDERGQSYTYGTGIEELMLEGLRAALKADDMSKLRCLRFDIKDVAPRSVPFIDVAFIDGEHTNTACFRDAYHLLNFMTDDGVIIFHDSDLITDAIQNF